MEVTNYESILPENKTNIYHLLLYNVHGLPDYATKYDGTFPNSVRMKEMSPHLNGFDFIGLNEAFTTKTIMLEKTNYLYKTQLGRSWNKVVDSGLMFLSNHRIVQTTKEHYDVLTNWDILSSKGFLSNIVQLTPELKVRFVLTHMQAGDTWLDQLARMSQAKQMASFLQQPFPHPTLFFGDLNMAPVPSPHYTDSEDEKCRINAYKTLREDGGLTEIHDMKNEGLIERVLIKNGERWDFGEVRTEGMKEMPGHLSDGGAMRISFWMKRGILIDDFVML